MNRTASMMGYSAASGITSVFRGGHQPNVLYFDSCMQIEMYARLYEFQNTGPWAKVRTACNQKPQLPLVQATQVLPLMYSLAHSQSSMASDLSQAKNTTNIGHCMH